MYKAASSPSYNSVGPKSFKGPERASNRRKAQYPSKSQGPFDHPDTNQALLSKSGQRLGSKSKKKKKSLKSKSSAGKLSNEKSWTIKSILKDSKKS